MLLSAVRIEMRQANGAWNIYLEKRYTCVVRGGKPVHCVAWLSFEVGSARILADFLGRLFQAPWKPFVCFVGQIHLWMEG